MAEFVIEAIALTAEGFAPFGDVVETRDRRWRWINQGTCQRFDDLAQVDVLEAGGRPIISIFKATPHTAVASPGPGAPPAVESRLLSVGCTLVSGGRR